MPSLRRTASSPAVRSSPYSSTYLGASRSSSNGGHPNRRSAPSETSNRRVLADIEWWRVTDGQCQAADTEADDRSPTTRTSNPCIGFLRQSWARLQRYVSCRDDSTCSCLWLTRTSYFSSVLRSGFAALSITPRTPVRRHSRESSFSSLESSPEPETAFPLPWRA
ncbi:hypothetical protein BDQ17DRAFT_1230707 [Cyathus striatus]|nr:hypothetical protein BDQ17DRAFT_1230707 [Cyathus striatus]